MESSALVEVDAIIRKAPYAVSGIRILLSFAFFFSLMAGAIDMAILFYAIAFVSDIVDGHLARTHKTTSLTPLEAYLDPMADFILVIISFSAFVLGQIYPAWILVVLILMFLFFLASSDRKRPVYDPVGKYYGTLLFTVIGITLLIPLEPILHVVLILIIGYTIGLVIFRTFFLWKQRVQI
jgi:phosphatidylglycerophosphate synthase